MDKEFSPSELLAIAELHEEWARQAHERDLHGSAKEWELTAAIARQCARLLEKDVP